MKPPCFTCLNRRCATESKRGGHVTVWGCTVRRIRFGYQWDYDAGANMPQQCAQYTQHLEVEHEL